MSVSDAPRKLLHVAAGLAPPLAVFLAGWTGAFAVALFGWAYLVLAWENTRRGIRLPLVGLLLRRHGPENGAETAALFMTSLVLVGVLFPLPYFFGAAMLLGLGDATAGWIGRKHGRHALPWNPKKSWEGLVAGLAVGIPAAAAGGLLGGIMVGAGYATAAPPRAPIDPWLAVALAPIGYGLVVLTVRFLVRRGRLTRYANAAPRTTLAALGVAMALPLAFLLTAPFFLPHPLLPLAGGHGPAAQALLLAVPLVPMLLESRINRGDNVWVPLAYAVVAYATVWIANHAV